MTERNAMKCLKIEKGKGFYSLNEEEWKDLDLISKDDLLAIIVSGISTGFIMDDYNVNVISNKAHEIIYKKLYDKLFELNSQKDRFKDESERVFKDAIDKYRV